MVSKRAIATAVLVLALSTPVFARGKADDPPATRGKSPIVRIVRFIVSIFDFQLTPPHP